MTEEIKNSLDLSLALRRTGGIPFLLRLADNALILAQRNSEWCGHGPVLEQDIALTNISLDLLGQARNFYQYAANLYNEASPSEKQFVDHLIPQQWKTFDRELLEDDLAFLREERQYLNHLICELPNGDWAKTILRQFFFSSFQFYLYQLLQTSKDTQLAAITAKAIKEVTYHLRWSSEWVIRLGDGTEESRFRMQKAYAELWPFTGELFLPAGFEPVDLSMIKEQWMKKVDEICTKATLDMPTNSEVERQEAGKKGRHTKHLIDLLTEMQYMQRTYPNATW